MTNLSPLQTLYDSTWNEKLPLPRAIEHLYGELMFPAVAGRPYVISNFVSTIDGVVTLGIPGMAEGDAISGKCVHDHAVMGILRTVADAIVIGATNLAASPNHIWTAGRVFPSLADDYSELRRRMGKEEVPLNVIVTSKGKINISLPIFQSGEVDVVVASTHSGATLLRQSKLPPSVMIDIAGPGKLLTSKEILGAVMRARPNCKIILVEGGPNLMGTFLADHALDELFLTMAPQIAGRTNSAERLGLVSSRNLAPSNPVWGKLISLKKAEDHLFLRYQFNRG